MDNKHFKEVLDFGIFKQDEFPSLQLPEEVDWEAYQYFTKVQTKDDKVIVFRSKFSSGGPSKDDIGYIDGEQILDKKIYAARGDWVFDFKNGFLHQLLRIEKYTSIHKKMELEIETTFPYSYRTGDLVFVHGGKAPNGKYHLSKSKSISVVDGKISEDTEEVYYEFGLEKNSKSIYWILLNYVILIAILLTSTLLFPFFKISAPLVIVLMSIFFLIGFAYYIFQNLIRFKIRFEKDLVIIGGSLNPRLIKKEEVKGYYFFYDYLINYSDWEKEKHSKNFSLVLNSKEQILLNLELLDEKMKPFKSFLKKNYPPELERKELQRSLSSRNLFNYDFSFFSTYSDGMTLSLFILVGTGLFVFTSGIDGFLNFCAYLPLGVLCLLIFFYFAKSQTRTE